MSDLTGPYAVDATALYQHVDQQRQLEGIAWLALAHGLGIPSSTFTRMAAGGKPAVDAFVTLMVWLLSRGVQPRQYSYPATERVSTRPVREANHRPTPDRTRP